MIEEHPTKIERLVVGVFAHEESDPFVPTLRSVFAHVDAPVVVGGPTDALLDAFDEFKLETRLTATPNFFVNELFADHHSHVLLITDPVVLPADFLEPAIAFVESDVRVASVSFFSNSADFLSFPYGRPILRPPEGHDETSLTRLLRSRSPSTAPVPIAFAAGAAVLLTASALGALGGFHASPSGKAGGMLAEFSLRARRRGFVSYLDPSTFYTRPSDIALDPIGSDFPDVDREWVNERHPFGAALNTAERTAGDSPFSLALRTSHAKAMGLRVLVDATNLGPTQMGTQTTILALIEALAKRNDVAEVGVVLAHEPPAYGRGILDLPNVRARICPGDDLSIFGRMDIGHRPFQPDQHFDRKPWRAVCDRFAVSMLDVIGYQIGSYHPDPETWLEYRTAVKHAVATVDGVFVISADVREQLQREALPIDPSRLFVVHYGTEHLLGNEPGRPPEDFVRRHRLADEFLLCLGTNYSHKNRDIAVRLHAALRKRGWNSTLVLAGAFVPFGSSRVSEAVEAPALAEDGIVVLPDISEQERNWLMRHASLVVYPTSAEGFGLVPFEAARFGTPTLNVGFGPLEELGGGRIPVVAADWSTETLVECAEALLRDPALAKAQVEASLGAGAEYTWARAAEEFASAYRALIAAPPRWPEGLPLPLRNA